MNRANPVLITKSILSFVAIRVGRNHVEVRAEMRGGSIKKGKVQQDGWFRLKENICKVILEEISTD